jgi:hypothetical protein
MWDIPGTAVKRGWELCCNVSPELAQLETASAVDTAMILAYVASIGMEYEQGVSIPIPLFKEAFSETTWMAILPWVSDQLEVRECSQPFLTPVEERFTPFEMEPLNPYYPGCVFLARRWHLNHITTSVRDDLGLCWSGAQFNLNSFFSLPNPSHNLVVFDDSKRIHNFSIGSQSNLVQAKLAAMRIIASTPPIVSTIEVTSMTNAQSWESLTRGLGLRQIEQSSMFHDEGDIDPEVLVPGDEVSQTEVMLQLANATPI